MITAMPRIAIAVHDFPAAVATFRDVLGVPVADFSERTVAALGAAVGMCVPEGGSNIELMAPANPRLPLSQSLQKFLDRRGDGLYALMLEAPDPNGEAVGLAERGLDVLALMAGAGGRDIHPRSTHGVLIRVYPDDSVRKPEGLRAADPSVSGITRVIIATDDATAAAARYGEGLGLAVDAPFDDMERGVRAVRGRAPKGGDIELVSVIDPGAAFAGRIAAFLRQRGEGMYALVLEADDLAAVADRLGGHGAVTDGLGTIEVNLHGARFLIEKRTA